MNNKSVSEKIRERIEKNMNGLGNSRNRDVDFRQKSPASYFCNDNISNFIEAGELELLVNEVEQQVETLLKSLVIDIEHDHNTRETARRVAKMFVYETFGGRYTKKPRITSFPNDLKYEELYVTGPISIRSVCAHHLQNIVGKCWIGVWPGKNVIGLSKFNRIVDWIASRPTIQEEMTVQIGDAIQEETEADGVAVIVKATHHCMTMRGVKEHDSDMTTSVMKGVFQNDKSLKNEFFQILNGMKGFGS